MEDILNFLKEYEKLCKKHKMSIEGCGCCGSPYLTYWGDNKIIDKECTHIENISYNHKTRKLETDLGDIKKLSKIHFFIGDEDK